MVTNLRNNLKKRITRLTSTQADISRENKMNAFLIWPGMLASCPNKPKSSLSGAAQLSPLRYPYIQTKTRSIEEENEQILP